MKDLLKLTRPTNLLIIVATMALMRYGVIGGHLERGLRQLVSEVGDVQRSELILPAHFGPQMPLLHFLLLVLSTVLIAAGGNVINDYFDTRIDRINKPGKVIVGRTVRRRVAMTAHAKHPDDALAFMEFLTSPEAQSIYAAANHEYPVSDAAAPSEMVASWGSFTPDNIDLTVLAHDRGEALKLTQEIDFDG